MAKLKLKKVRSTIKRPGRQKATMEALGLRKMNSEVEVEATPQILGMVNKVRHLIEITEL
ncbi:MAG: ribosomal protein [Bacteroidota bacterium]|jgi:large subunit ribosomal protein L30